jgi:DNA adenine methylase
MDHRRFLETGQRDYYDEVKAEYNKGILAQSFGFEQAVRFIFLNRSNFNGVYRVNLKGTYNVPIGSTCRPYIPPEEIFIQASARLKHAELTHGDFEVPLKDVREGDFVYLDPPYPKLSPTANFNHYTLDPFSEKQQRKLAAIAHTLKEKCVNVMISNAGVPLIEELFEQGWTIHITEISRRVSAKRPPLMAKELIITSFPS